MVSSVPSPLPSIGAPFQDDAGREARGGRSARRPVPGTALSRSNGGYLPPQALYSQSTSAGGSAGGPARNIGP